MDDPCYHIGGGVPLIDIKIKDPMCGISRSPTSGTSYKWYLHVVSFQQSSDVHKKCKIQASTIYPKCKPLHQWEAHLLWKLMTKGEILYKDMKSFGRDWDKEVEVGHGHGQRGSNIEEKRLIKIFGQQKHTNRGSKLIDFDWLHLICAYSYACLHCISFQIQYACLCGCMLVVELEWWFDN